MGTYEDILVAAEPKLAANRARRTKLANDVALELQSLAPGLSATTSQYPTDASYDNDIQIRYEGLKGINANVSSVMDYGKRNNLFSDDEPDKLADVISAIRHIALESPETIEKEGLEDFVLEDTKYNYGKKYSSFAEYKANIGVDLPTFKEQDLKMQDAVKRYQEGLAQSSTTVILDDGADEMIMQVPIGLGQEDAKFLAKKNINSPMSVGVLYKDAPTEPIFDVDPGLVKSLGLPEAERHTDRFNALRKDGRAPLQSVYVPINTNSDGAVGVSVAAYRQLFVGYYADIMLKQRGQSYLQLNKADQQALLSEAKAKAQTRVAKIQNSNQSSIFVDVDPDDTNLAISEGTDPIGNILRYSGMWAGPLLAPYVSDITLNAVKAASQATIGSDLGINTFQEYRNRLLAPISATVHPLAYDSDKGVTLGPKVLQSNEHSLHWLLRVSAGLPIAAFLFNEDLDWNDWGSPDHIKHIRSGEDVGSYFPAIAREINQATGIEANSYTAMTLAGAATLTMIVFDPDLITPLTLGVGKAFKAGKGIAETAVIAHRIRSIDSAIAALGTGAKYEDVVATMRRSSTPELAELFEVEVAGRMGIPAKVSAQADKLESSIPLVQAQVTKFDTALNDAIATGDVTQKLADDFKSNVSYLLNAKQALIARAAQNNNLIVNYAAKILPKLNAKGYKGGVGATQVLDAASVMLKQYQKAVTNITHINAKIPSLRQAMVQASVALPTGKLADPLAFAKARRALVAAQGKAKASQRIINTLKPVVGHHMIAAQIVKLSTESAVVGHGLKHLDKLISKQVTLLGQQSKYVSKSVDEVNKAFDKYIVEDERLKFYQNIRPTALDAAKAIRESLQHLANVSAPVSSNIVADRAAVIRRYWTNPDIPYHILSTEPATWIIRAKVFAEKMTTRGSALFNRLGGKYTPEIQTITRKMVELSSLAQSELTHAAMHSDAPLDTIVKYLTDTAPIKMRYGNTVVNTGDKTLWQKFVEYVRYDKMGLKENDALNAVVRAFIPPGRTGDELVPLIRAKTVNYLKKMDQALPQDVQFNRFVQEMQAITNYKYATNEAYNRALSFIAYGVADGALKMDFYVDLGKLVGPGLTPELINLALRGGEGARSVPDLAQHGLPISVRPAGGLPSVSRIPKLSFELPKDSTKLTDVQRIELFDTFIALAQRRHPENAMLRLQERLGGGVMSVMVEHIGDLSHRLTENVTARKGGIEAITEKVKRAHRYLNNEYGFEKEFLENMKNNAEYNKIPLKEFTAKIDKAMAEYAEAHKNIPVFNKVQLWARNAAIALGKKDFDGAGKYINNLRFKLADGEDAWVAATRIIDPKLYDEFVAEYNKFTQPVGKVGDDLDESAKSVNYGYYDVDVEEVIESYPVDARSALRELDDIFDYLAGGDYEKFAIKAELGHWLQRHAPTSGDSIVADRVIQRITELEQAGVTFSFGLNADKVSNHGLHTLYKNHSAIDIFLHGPSKTIDYYEIVLHELVHAATTRAVILSELGNMDVIYKIKPASGKYAKDLKIFYQASSLRFNMTKLFQEVHAAFFDLPIGKTPEHVYNDIRYGLKNVDEFLAMGLTNPNFQKFLKSVKVPKSTRTAFTSFVTAIKEFFGLAVNDTALDRFLELSDKYMKVPYEETLYKQAYEYLDKRKMDFRSAAGANATNAAKATKAIRTRAPRDFTTVPRITPGGHVDALAELYKQLNLWGMDTLIKFSPGGINQADMNKLIREVTSHPNATSAIPEALYDAVNKSIDGFIKEMTPWANQASHWEMPIRQWKRFNALLRTGMVTGLLYPRVAAWVTDTIGTFASLYTETGDFTKAVRTTTQSSMQYMPVVGPYIARKVAEAKKAGNVYVPDFITTLFDPNLQRLMNQSQDVVTINGRTLSYSDLYKEAAGHGVFTHILTEDLISINQRSMNKTANVFGLRNKNLYTQYRQSWTDHYEYAQRVRNGAVYLQMLEKYTDPVKAARETLRVTYDWRMAATEWERAFFGIFATFYVFSKLQMQQIARIFSEPLLNPDAIDYVAKDFLLGNTKIGALKKSAIVAHHTPDYLDFVATGGSTDIKDDKEQYDEALMRRIGWWKNNKLVIDVKEMNIPTANWYMNAHKPASHYITTVPSLSTLEATYTYGLFVQLLWGMTLQGMGGNVVMNDDAPYMIIEEFTKRMSPIFQPFAQKAVQGMTNNTFDNPLGESARLPETQLVNAADYGLTKLGFDNFATIDEHGKMKVPPYVLAFLRGMPAINEMSNAWAGVMNPELNQSYAAYINYMFRHFTGVLKYQPLNPKDDIDFALKELKDKFADTEYELRNKAAR